MEATEIRMNCKMMAALVAVVGLSLSASATIYTFPTAGGDLSSATAWGSMRPTSADTAKIDKAGIYSLSEDVTFKDLDIRAAGCTFAIGGNKMTFAAVTGNSGIRVVASNGRTVLDGGTFDLVGANFQPNHAANDMVMVVTNGCVVTNVGSCYAGIVGNRNQLVVMDDAEVYAEKLFLAYNGGQGNSITIEDGGHVYVSNYIYSEGNATKGSYGGHVLEVRGSESFLRHAGSDPICWGFQCHSNIFRISDRAAVYSLNGGLTLGQGGAACSNNCVYVENCATGSFKDVRCNSAGNVISVSNATLICSGEFDLGYAGASSSNNLFRAYGANTVLTLPTGKDLFSSRSKTNSFCTVSLEHGVTWNCGGRNMMGRTHNSVFRITGNGTVVGDSASDLYFGDKDVPLTMDSVSNRLEVLDGAMLHVKRIPVMGVANTLCVSNATLNITADSVGLRMGYRSSGSLATNCVLVLQGKMPKVDIEDTDPSNTWTCRFDNGSTLRFEIPADGYAKDYVPFETENEFTLVDNASCLEIACDEFVAKTGGKLHLIHAGSISSTTANRLKACVLPERCSLIVDGGDVYLKSPKRSGLVISFY